jgi:hypothetical protein
LQKIKIKLSYNYEQTTKKLNFNYLHAILWL